MTGGWWKGSDETRAPTANGDGPGAGVASEGERRTRSWENRRRAAGCIRGACSRMGGSWWRGGWEVKFWRPVRAAERGSAGPCGEDNHSIQLPPGRRLDGTGLPGIAAPRGQPGVTGLFRLRGAVGGWCGARWPEKRLRGRTDAFIELAAGGSRAPPGPGSAGGSRPGSRSRNLR